MTKFKKEYNLGRGYPWALGKKPYKQICLCELKVFSNQVELKFPDELWADCPQYDLILRRVEKKK